MASSLGRARVGAPMLSSLLLTVAALPSVELPEAHAAAEVPRVLFLTHSAGFVHSVVRRPAPDQLAHAERVQYY